MKMRRSAKSREALSTIAVSIKYHQHDNPVTWIRENGENFEQKTSDTIDRSTGIGNNSDDDRDGNIANTDGPLLAGSRLI